MDMNHRPFRDGRSIDADDENEIRFWMKYLNASKDQLLRAVSAVGSSAQRVKDYLEARRDAESP